MRRRGKESSIRVLRRGKAEEGELREVMGREILKMEVRPIGKVKSE